MRKCVVWGSIMSVLLVSTAACGKQESGEGGTDGTYEYAQVDTPNGPVDCIIWDGTRAGNITCDWDK